MIEINNNNNKKIPLVFTISDRCKTCYTCIRECPAKAISMQNGQANVIPERCIACGNCVKVCTRDAKSFYNEQTEVMELLASATNVIACIAPSFPAEFKEIEDYKVVVGMIRNLGFQKVVEVSFGADLVAERYKELIQDETDKKYISSDCPAIVGYITKYHPHLTENLAPIVSPVMAIVKVIKELYGQDSKVVFIGPCIAKKNESDSPDNVLTFRELRRMLHIKKISPETVTPSDFDPPHGGRGSIFPVNRGLLNTVQIQENLIQGNIIVAEGRVNFKDAITEFENGLINDHHLELLCCDGCIMGPGMFTEGKKFENQAYVTRYVRQKLENINWEEWQNYMERFKTLNLSRKFSPDDSRVKMPTKDEIESIYILMGKTDERDRLDCHACGYESCEEHAIAVLRGLAEIDMCLPYTLEQLKNLVNELNFKNTKLESMQQALKQSEKLAHLGQLSAGIAHELNNPLGVVIMYANILLDEFDEQNPYYQDIKIIGEQAERCKKIVGGLLNFARKNKVAFANVDIHEFIQSCVRSVVIPENVNVKIKNYLTIHDFNIDKEQMTQAITNIIKNAVEAMPDGGDLIIVLSNNSNEVEIKISDTGTGIAPEHMDKLFTPFFTTKPLGKGTGLGLPTTYGIVKMHKGRIDIESNSDKTKGPTGTSFIVTLPLNKNLEQ